MNRFRFSILPRLRLMLSLLVLLLGLYALWLALDRPLPFPLALRQAEEAYFFPHGEILASGPLGYEEPGRWVLSRSGEKTFLLTFRRTAGVLWSPEPSCTFFWPEEDEELSAVTVGLDITPLTLLTTPLAFCPDPDVVTMEADLLWMFASEEEDPQLLQKALEERAVTVQLSPVENGFWSSGPVELPSGSGGLTIFCRGYDADGRLICQSPALNAGTGTTPS